MEYLAPFLEVIRSPETSGPITGTALTSLTRFLSQDIIGVPSSCRGLGRPFQLAHSESIALQGRRHSSKGDRTSRKATKIIYATGTVQKTAGIAGIWSLMVHSHV